MNELSELKELNEIKLKQKLSNIDPKFGKVNFKRRIERIERIERVERIKRNQIKNKNYQKLIQNSGRLLLNGELNELNELKELNELSKLKELNELDELNELLRSITIKTKY